MKTANPLAELSAAGVSIWLDDLSRERIVSGNLQELIDTRSIVGVTTNPTIFAGALSKGHAYAEQVARLAAAGTSAADAVFQITTDDVAAACDILLPIYEATAGFNGRVSIEVEPGLAHDAAATIAQARQLWTTVDRPNTLIKIPATIAGLEAITETIGAGISVNVTLIFSLDRYRQVIDAYLAGLEKAQSAGIDISTLHSVASFFVSRVDTEVDRRLGEIGSPEALALKSRAAVANARLAYQVFEEAFATERAAGLLAAGANRQRPLWASTGVKDPAVPDTEYVVELVAPHVVNTAPEKTIEATADHGIVRGNTIAGTYSESQAVLDAIAALGISYQEVVAQLENEGVAKFIVSWNELLDTVDTALGGAGE